MKKILFLLAFAAGALLSAAELDFKNASFQVRFDTRGGVIKDLVHNKVAWGGSFNGESSFSDVRVGFCANPRSQVYEDFSKIDFDIREWSSEGPGSARITFAADGISMTGLRLEKSYIFDSVRPDEFTVAYTLCNTGSIPRAFFLSTKSIFRRADDKTFFLPKGREEKHQGQLKIAKIPAQRCLGVAGPDKSGLLMEFPADSCAALMYWFFKEGHPTQEFFSDARPLAPGEKRRIAVRMIFSKDVPALIAGKDQQTVKIKGIVPAQASQIAYVQKKGARKINWRIESFRQFKLSHPDSWSLVVVPDVQAYTERPRNHGIVDIMNTWILDNQDNLKIQQVLYTGDLVYRNDQKRLSPDKYSLLAAEQWKGFSRLMERLDGRIPYILCTGNHDYGHNSSENRNTYYNDYFPTDRNPQSRKHLIGCNYNAFGFTTLENAAYEFTAPAPDNRKFLVFTLQFAPTDSDLEWAKNLAAQPRYADHIGIVLTHSYLAWTGKRLEKENYQLNKEGGNTGEGIFRKLVYPSPNIRMVICGHISAPDQWEKGISFSMDKNCAGKTVAQMAFNTQAIGGGWHGSGGDGWLRLLEFMPDKKTIKARTFSPLFAISPSTRHLAWRRDALNEFTFTLE